MKCIYCGSKTKITNSRFLTKSQRTWRRHACSKCRAIFTTFEAVDTSQSYRINKRNGAIEPFSRAKLYVSVYRSLDHRKSAPDDAEALTDTILSQLMTKNQALIDSEAISRAIASVLKRFDSAAAIRYQSFQKPLTGKRDIQRAMRP